MAFLAPWFLVGLAALALPVLLHLRKNKPKKKVEFSTLMFLEATPPVTRRATKLQDLLLLLLRCLGLALLVIAFSRPFFRQQEKTAAAAGGGVLHFLLVDTSASMRGEPLQKALSKAEALIRELPENDWIAVAAYADGLQPLLGPMAAKQILPGERKSSASAMLGEIKPGWRAACPEAAWPAAAALAAETAGSLPVRVHVFSDFKKGAAYDGLRGGDWPEGVSFTLHRMEMAEGWTNAGVSALAGGDHPRARVTNAEGSAKADFMLEWGQGAAPQPVSVPPGESLVIDAPDGVKGEGMVKLSGDGPIFDNESAWAPLVRPTARIRYVGGAAAEDTEGSLFFLTKAMQPTEAYDVRIEEGPSPDLTVAAGRLDETQFSSLQATLEAGGNVLLLLEDVGETGVMGRLIGAGGAEGDEAAVQGFALLGEIDFKSTVFSPFADPRYSDFSGIRFWRYRVLPQSWLAQAAVLARFDSGEPAWLRYGIGKGALHVLTTSWRPADSQLALSTKFPPLLHALLSQSPALAVRAARYAVGQPVPLPDGVGQVMLPDGTAVAVVEGKPFIAETPGIHRLVGNGGSITSGVTSGAFAVQIAASESELTPLPDEEFKALALPMETMAATAMTAGGTDLADIEQESRQRVGWWLLLAAAAVFLIETLLAARRSAGRTPTSEPIRA